MAKCTVYFLIQIVVTLCIFRTINCQGWVVKDEGCRTPDRGVGNCITIRECQPMIDFLKTIKKPYSQYIVAKLNAYTCGYDKDQLQICCPPGPINIVDPTVSTTPATILEPPDVSSHRNLKLLPEDCGYLDIGDKIRNGVNASLNEFPWMALLSYRTASGPKFKCGGTIINEKFILTAAHCLANLKEPLIGVRVGEHDILKTTDCETQPDSTEKCNPPVQDLAAQEIIIHPNYDSSRLTNDIGLVRVDKMNLNIESTRPVCLPLESARLQTFNYAIVTGWGYTGFGGKSSSILQRVELPVVKLEDCQKVYKSQPNVIITNKQLCAGGKEQKDSCGGDSGGPLQAAAFLNEDTRYVQHGVVSFGPKFCGLDGFPGVYTRVAYYMDWILDNLNR